MNLYNADCMDILPTIKSNSIDLVIIDPPYDIPNIVPGSNSRLSQSIGRSLRELEESDIISSYDITKVNTELVRVMRGINIYIWCNKKQIPEYLNFYVTKLNCAFEILCWHKTNATPLFCGKYLTDTEYCLYFHKDSYCKPSYYDDARTYYIAPINVNDKKYYQHPTIKPLDIMERFIRNSSRVGDVVLDCFMGAGTTGVACKDLQRDFIGVEISKKWFDIAKERIDMGSATVDTSEELDLSGLE